MHDSEHDSESRALVPAARAPLRPGAVRALVLAARSPVVRRAVMAGAALGLAYQLSRRLRGRGPARLGSSVWDAYRKLARGASPAEDWREGGWVRRSLTVVSVVYTIAERSRRT